MKYVYYKDHTLYQKNVVPIMHVIHRWYFNGLKMWTIYR